MDAAQISDDEIIGFLNESRTLAREAAEHQGSLRNHRKRGQSAGMNVRAWAQALRAIKRSDPDAVMQDLRDQLHYMSLMRLPITADDLFAGVEIRVTNNTRVSMDLWDAYDLGYKAGRHGQDIAESPYEPGQECHAEWLRAWHAGQASIARELGPDTEQATASRKRPRQPRMAGTERRGRRRDGADTEETAAAAA